MVWIQPWKPMMWPYFRLPPRLLSTWFSNTILYSQIFVGKIFITAFPLIYAPKTTPFHIRSTHSTQARWRSQPPRHYNVQLWTNTDEHRLDTLEQPNLDQACHISTFFEIFQMEKYNREHKQRTSYKCKFQACTSIHK